MASNIRSQNIDSNEKLSKTKNVQQRRDSFEERICDDLCEAILQWLPFDEKIKLIDVSKQFNRCLKLVWNSQKVLKMGSNAPNDPNDCLELVTQLTPRSRNPSFRKASILTILLHHFPNITSFELGGRCDRFIDQSQVLDLITIFCNKLDTLKSYCDKFESKSMMNFALKLGPNIKTLDFFIGDSDVSDFKLLLRLCDSLTSLEHIGAFDFDLLPVFNDNKSYVFVNNLKKLSAYMYFNNFSKLIENNKSLTHLKVSLETGEIAEISGSFKLISELKVLEYLRIGLIISFSEPIDDINYQQIAKSFQLMAKNCINLKTFDFNVLSARKLVNTNDFFNVFNEFSSLNRIKYCDNKCNGYNLSINCIKNCKLLTHLTIDSRNITPDFFSSIQLIFPHLKHLLIVIENTFTDEELTPISRLTNLESLSINSRSNEMSSITDFGLLLLINGCNHLNNLSINCKTCISDESIELIIGKAIANPGIYFRYSFCLNFSDKLVSKIESTVKCLNVNNIEIEIIKERKLIFNDMNDMW